MTDNMLTLSETARDLIKADVRAFKRDAKRYADYVVECEITEREEVKAHVAIFRDTFRIMYPNASGDEVKAYATKVRNGLNYWVGKSENNTDTDWIRLVRQAAENAAVKGGKSADEIMAAVVDALGGSVEFGEGADGFPISLVAVDAA